MLRPRFSSICRLPALGLLLFIQVLMAQVSVLTSHNDNSRTGLNTNEVALTRSNVNMYGFGKLFAQPVDGPIYTQPLYVPNLAIPGKGVHNVVYVATEHDSVYAFDADTISGSNSIPLWHRSFINPAQRITAVPAGDAAYPRSDCQTFVGEIGITGTPVIDAASGTMYLVARTKEPNATNSQSFVQVQRLHALDILTGQDKPNSPVVVGASVPGTAADNVGGILYFDPVREVQRCALLLLNGGVYIAWTSYCDYDPYHGWILGYDAQTLQQVAVFNNTPNGGRGGIWMGGGGLAAASDGTVYCTTGNGTFDPTGIPQDFGDSFLKLGTSPGLSLLDYFTPANEASLAAADEDLGSGGAILLPDDVGSTAHPHLVTGAGKQGIIYLLDRDNLGHYNSAGDSQIIQEASVGGTVFGMPGYFNKRVYFQVAGQQLKAFSISNAVLSSAPVSQSLDAEPFFFRGSSPCITANGKSNGIVWELVVTTSFGVTALRAYNSDDLSQKLYDSWLSWRAGLPDRISYIKFAVPTIANGKVYVGTDGALAVFGLRTYFWSAIHDTAAGAVRLVFSGPTGMPNTLQVSEDLAHWTDLGNGTPTGTGTFSYNDPIVPGTPHRFYRVSN
jgi:hypothetical protein